jgi:hypothetical protein
VARRNAWLAVIGALASGQVIGQTRPWYELDTSWMSMRFHLAVMEDGALYTQDAASEEQVGNLKNEQLFRIDDLEIAGTIKFAKPWSYRFGGNYKGLDPTASATWSSTYVYLAIPLGDLATLSVGKQKQAVGLELIEDARHLAFMEHSTMTTGFAFIDAHVVGVRFSGTAATSGSRGPRDGSTTGSTTTSPSARAVRSARVGSAACRSTSGGGGCFTWVSPPHTATPRAEASG